jgi:hypothetical protein
VAGHRIVLLGELNDFVLGDEIGASLTASADFDVFKILVDDGLILCKTDETKWMARGG